MSVIASRISTLTGFYSTPVLQKIVKYIYWFMNINVFRDWVKSIKNYI